MGGEGLALAETKQPALIVLDLMMPRLDGLEVCRRLRAFEVWSPTLMLTALDDVRLSVKGSLRVMGAVHRDTR